MTASRDRRDSVANLVTQPSRRGDNAAMATSSCCQHEAAEGGITPPLLKQLTAAGCKRLHITMHPKKREVLQMTISDIAKMAGVSSAAVSRYLNGGP